MSKMVKLSDEVGYSLSKRAEEDGLTMSGEVAKLLATSEMPPHPTDLDYFDKKFEHLESLIENNLVDVVAAGTGGGRAPGEKKYLDWDNFRYIVYELLKEGDAEWASQQSYLAIENLDDEIHVYEKNGSLWVDDYYGRPSCILNISPRVREAIDKNFTFND